MVVVVEDGGTRKMPQEVKVLATKPGNLNLIPRTHVIEKSQLLFGFHMCVVTYVGPHHDTQNKQM